MKNRLYYVFRNLILLACLGMYNTAQAEESAAQSMVQQQLTVQPANIGPLAWQRVGAPISLEA